MSLGIYRALRGCVISGLGLFLFACGGSGGSPSPTPSSSPTPSASITDWQRGVFPNQDDLAARCENPRTGTDPFNGNQAFPDESGSAAYEKMWLRSWTNDFYLWYDEVDDQNHASFSVLDYFDELVTNELTNSGNFKDNFHFSVDTQEWNELSQGGSLGAGYGMQLLIDNNFPREIIIAYVEPDSPAANAGLYRGTRITAVDGVSVTTETQAGIDALNAGTFPGEVGEEHDFMVRWPGETISDPITMTAEEIITTPVLHEQIFENEDTKVGYFLFNDHIATAETALMDVFENFETENIDELIVDLRYNGGGYLAIASQVAYMVAGQTATQNKTFELLNFNDKANGVNPITRQTISPEPFYSTTLGFSESAGQSLPSLNLSRVFVIATADTCSASEAIINGLRGVDVEVILIGSQTCGKPYGFYAADNCGTTYFSIQFQGVNEKGFGDYADGFVPSSTDNGEDFVLGCAADDDVEREFIRSEDSIATALTYIKNGACTGESFNKTDVAFRQKAKSSKNYSLLGVPAWRKAAIMER